MRRLFRFNAPKQRHFAMQFGYDKQPTFWHEVRSNAHLIIAGVGTVALLSVAAFALWLALPADDRQAVASTEQVVPAIPVRTVKIVAPPRSETGPAEPVQQAAAKGDAVVKLNTPDEDAAIIALSSNDPRWSAPAAKAPGGTVASQAVPAASAAEVATASATSSSSAVSAFAPSATAAAAVRADPAPADAKPQPDETAAIPAVKPTRPDDKADTADPGDKKTQQAGAAGNGRILRSVTMRSGPQKNAAVVMGSVPANATVQVITCNSWCQIVYKGKRGWIYKGFLSGAGGKSSAGDTVRSKNTARKATPAKSATPASQQLPGVDTKIFGRS